MQNLLSRDLHQFNVAPFPSNGRQLWKAYVKQNNKAASPQFLLGVFSHEQQATNACYHNSPPVWVDNNNSNAPNQTPNTCKLCSKGFALLSRAHHCRNCGCVCCSECSPTFWPAKMVPSTYHLSEKKVRVCRACHTLMEQFRGALLKGTDEDFDRAIACISTTNINLMSPYSIYSDCLYPVHCAAIGGNVEIFKYLVEAQGCALSFVRNGGVEPYRTKSSETCLRERVVYELVASLLAGNALFPFPRCVSRGVTIKEVRNLKDLQTLVDKLIRATPTTSSSTTSSSIPTATIQEEDGQGEEILAAFSAASLSSTSTTPTQPNPLTDCWVQHFDEASGRNYYYNGRTGATSWEPPPGWEDGNPDLNFSASAPTLDPHNRPSMDNNNNNDDDDDQCAVCMDKRVEGCFTPCGHMVCCVECGEALDSCPICRETVSFIKTFRN
ncbi:hypothetical protein TL16_g00495 [Triparma laevis f. inornata]|uniref:Uncharacterized protein n=1 Tax=Triparma laevis f. inornata TaxID=1714386 RepID=A0A9W6ZFC5_9STRA|nr:hypothetical protein TL16_g00495 [Triparma laevis f. inornata]